MYLREHKDLPTEIEPINRQLGLYRHLQHLNINAYRLRQNIEGSRPNLL